eukprot:362987-Chlamydomonas_euryale.AAC.6
MGRLKGLIAVRISVPPGMVLRYLNLRGMNPAGCPTLVTVQLVEVLMFECWDTFMDVGMSWQVMIHLNACCSRFHEQMTGPTMIEYAANGEGRR